MNKYNNPYLYNQPTLEKRKRYHEKKHGTIITNHKCYYDDKGSNFSQTKSKNGLYNKIEINKENISIHKNKNYFYSSINLNNISTTNKPLNYNIIQKKKEIPQYNKIQIPKRKYQRYNSVAYIKKRPNDLMRIQNYENNSVIYNKFLQTTLKTKGRCLSCTNIKKGIDLLNNNDKISKFDIDNNNSSKKSLVPLSYSIIPKNEIINDRNVNNFTVKRQKKILNKKLEINFCNNIFKVIKKHLLYDKMAFLKKIKMTKIPMYEVSYEDYKFLEELKGLGVTNKKELNLLLKDIYISIKGNNK